MNTHTTLIMFGVLAAFGLVTATLVIPIVPQAYAAGGGPSPQVSPEVIEKACSNSHGVAFQGSPLIQCKG